jgi:hypothetical protein
MRGSAYRPNQMDSQLEEALKDALKHGKNYCTCLQRGKNAGACFRAFKLFEKGSVRRYQYSSIVLSANVSDVFGSPRMLR